MPTTVSAGSPSSKRMTVGIDRTPYREAVAGVLVNVECAEFDLLIVVSRHVFEDRRDHSARATPWGPEIDNHRVLRMDDVFIERCVCDFGEIAHRGTIASRFAGTSVILGVGCREAECAVAEMARMIVAVSSATPRNAELAEQFELLTDLLELDGADGFRLQAYRRAASRIRESTAPVAQLAIEGKATRLDGIGPAIEAKIVEFTETGDMKALAEVRGRIPLGLVDVMHVPGLGPKTAIRLWEELGGYRLRLAAGGRRG